MKQLIRKIFVSSIAVYIASLLLTGLKIQGGYENYLIAGVFITFADYVIRPVISIITLPFNAITFGLFQVVVNAILLYIITLIYPKLSIGSFQFPGISYSGFAIPSFYSNEILSYVIISVTIYSVIKLFFWLFDER
ncbi:hypothetical protein C4577_04010 [Candidatus Parcubacteria bacterium]|nr:MAG: hypothetical protein C4577_04010 [Candidatus Parcubacteria bacterium]